MMTWSRTDNLSSLLTDGLFPDRISILRTNGRPPFRTDELFRNRIFILRMNSILRMGSVHLNGLLIPNTNDSPYERLPVGMTPRMNDSTLRIYLRGSSLNKLMTWFRLDYLSSLLTDDLIPDRISILRTNGWPPFRTDDLFPNRISILRTNYYELSREIKT